MRDHPDDEGIYAAARVLIEELSTFTTERDLLPELGGTCRVGPAPPSRRYAVAMMSWTGAYEPEAPASLCVNQPEPSWDEETKERWRSLFSATTLPAVIAHEVMPGHFAHGRMIRLAARGDVRRSLFSLGFVEGWAHYAEELLVEEGFRQDDPRFAIGVWVEALVRVTRFASALGIHRGTMTVRDAAARFREDAFLEEPAAQSEASRATFDPTYGRYTWGKLEIQALRDEAIALMGHAFQPQTVPRGPARTWSATPRDTGRCARTCIDRARVSGGLLSLSASMPLPLVVVVSTDQTACIQDFHEANHAFHAVEAVDDERRLDPPSQAPSQEPVKLHARSDRVGEQLSENEPPGLFGYVELEFIERLARRFAADKAPSVVGTQRRPHMRHPSSHGTHDESGVWVERGQLLTHVEVPTLQCGLCREDSAHGLRLGQEIDRVLEAFQFTS